MGEVVRVMIALVTDISTLEKARKTDVKSRLLPTIYTGELEIKGLTNYMCQDQAGQDLTFVGETARKRYHDETLIQISRI